MPALHIVLEPTRSLADWSPRRCQELILKVDHEAAEEEFELVLVVGVVDFELDDLLRLFEEYLEYVRHFIGIELVEERTLLLVLDIFELVKTELVIVLLPVQGQHELVEVHGNLSFLEVFEVGLGCVLRL